MKRLGRHTVMIVGILLVGMLFLLQGCSANKNTAANRRYQEFITRYNIHYNGDTHYKETLHDMESKYEDDFTRLLFTHPAEARAVEKVPQPQGDFTRSIEKAQKAIQLRSIKKKPARKPGRSSDPAYKAWMKRDEYNPFLHNSWMMMGRSQFMNGDFSGAAATFFYISRHFNWLPATVVEAKLWQARSYCAMGWLFEAETILTRIKTEELTSKTLKRLYNETYADYLVRSHQYAEALPYLIEATRLSSGAQKTRLNFLTGQVAALAGDRQLAYRAFGKAAGSSSASYRTQFNARIKQSEVFEGKNIRQEVNSLRHMLRYDRNKDYQDQIYYAIANLYLSRGDTLKAIENYRLAAEKSTRNGIDKAISQVTLAGLYYDRREYDLAQPCYAEGVPVLPETYPDYKMMKQRSDVLDELAVYVQNVNLQDSLLRLSRMTPEERLKVVEKIIKELEKKEKEDGEAARREDFMANRPTGNMTGNNADRTFTMNNDGSWYFYNQSTVQAGKTEFQRRWGNRKLEDDWRRRNKAAFSFDEFGDNENTVDDNADAGDQKDGSVNAADALVDEDKKKKENDPHFPEYYLRQIPADSAARTLSHEIIQEGLYNMGLILKDKLEDYPSATIPWNRLLSDYPDNIYRLDTYFNLYLMAARSGDKSMAEHFRNLILSDFAESKEGIALRDPDYLDNLRLMDQRQENLYQAAFDAYMDDRNADVHRLYDDMSSRFSMSPLMPRFMFLHALSYVTEQQPEKFKEVLTEMLERYPDTDLSPYASSWLKGLAQGRQLMSDNGSNMRGLLWDIRLSTDSVGTGDGTPLEFELNPEDTQLLVLLYPTDAISHNQLLYDIARHNFNTFAIRDFD
ncbi:MAG: tetratricopeptide repeat protein, partial [Muribaculaceae bacterium]|nr:tetratricopeptide repeat protein [Muribaculaceae bacterium]